MSDFEEENKTDLVGEVSGTETNSLDALIKYGLERLECFDFIWGLPWETRKILQSRYPTETTEQETFYDTDAIISAAKKLGGYDKLKESLSKDIKDLSEAELSTITNTQLINANADPESSVIVVSKDRPMTQEELEDIFGSEDEEAVGNKAEDAKPNEGVSENVTILTAKERTKQETKNSEEVAEVVNETNTTTKEKSGEDTAEDVVEPAEEKVFDKFSKQERAWLEENRISEDIIARMIEECGLDDIRAAVRMNIEMEEKNKQRKRLAALKNRKRGNTQNPESDADGSKE